jgi:probable HAF family extracellular repeat protein
LIGNTYSTAAGINNAGQVVGTVVDSSTGLSSGFVYSGGTVSYLAAPTYGESYGNGINNVGQIAGTTFSVAQGFIPALYPSAGTFIHLGTFGGYGSSSMGINDLGQVVGYSFNTGGQSNAFLYSGGPLVNLGTLGGDASVANGINNIGQVVGNSNTSGDAEHAFLYSTGSGMVDLNTLYASLLVSGTTSQAGFTVLTDATAINNLGAITGDGTYWNGTADEQEAFLLEPVPESSNFAMMGCAMCLLTYLRMRMTRTL